MARFDFLELGSNPEEPERPAPTVGRERQFLVDEDRQPLKLADRHRRRGEYETALKYYSRALELDKSLVVGWASQIQMLVQLDEAPEAELWSRKALELFPGNGELMAGRAQALCRLGDTKQAGPACDAAMTANGKSAYRWMVRGEWMIASRQKLDEHCFTKAREVDADWLVPLESALIYLHYRFPSRALVRVRQAIETAPDQFYPWFVRGTAEAELDMNRAAAESFEHCLQLCPGHHEADVRLRTLGANWSIGRALRNFFRR